ncbi:hypothetical protein [Rhizobium phaseoli]|uniref:hypothetical protein n=1 Tax=Rhizobium phaseoli TaxID=396 RepID=UPI0002E031C2|nr:hypothetical protein [Rhizobium phaseoli]ANL38090.1 hypothetical protein AMC89_PD00632 [Rhizobium phaseoli]ANM01799.1 hypothetical protein AMC79_PD00631 [Rhizobium phaseoli]
MAFTARYQLAPKRTAFGLRVSQEGSSRANPFGETTLWLFAIEGDGLKPIRDDVVVRESHGEWDTVCAGEFSETTRTLSMVPSAKDTVADIIVTETTTTSVNRSERIMIATAKIRRRSTNTGCGTTDRDMAFPKT